MPYDIDIQTNEGYVRVRLTGTRQEGDAALDASRAGRQIVEYCRDVDIFRVLIILELRGRLSAVDSFEMVAESEQYGWDYGFKLAFVDINKDSVEDVRFTETVAVNRGYSVKAFTDEAKALDWLVDGA